jgi:GTP-binding protein
VKIKQIEPLHIASKPGNYPALIAPEIAFLGRSNVGKSSLINSLVNRKALARTSKAPGRTRAIHWYRLEGDGEECLFVDLPGYGYARVAREIRETEWAKLIETYLHSDRPLCLAVQLLDIRRDGPTPLDEQMIAWLRSRELPAVYVLTKADKLSRLRRAEAVRTFARKLGLRSHEQPIAYSATTGEGKPELWSWIDAGIRGASPRARTTQRTEEAYD